jgi:hypothetical protein
VRKPKPTSRKRPATAKATRRAKRAKLIVLGYENIERIEWTLSDTKWQPTRQYVEKMLNSYKELLGAAL